MGSACVCAGLLMSRIHFDAIENLCISWIFMQWFYAIYIFIFIKYTITLEIASLLLLFYNVNILDFHHDMMRFVIRRLLNSKWFQPKKPNDVKWVCSSSFRPKTIQNAKFFIINLYGYFITIEIGPSLISWRPRESPPSSPPPSTHLFIYSCTVFPLPHAPFQWFLCNPYHFSFSSTHTLSLIDSSHLTSLLVYFILFSASYT